MRMNIKLFTLQLSLALADAYDRDAIALVDGEWSIPKFIDKPKFTDRDIESILATL